MASISARLIAGTSGAAIMAPVGAGLGALAGYIYAKLADLPAGQAAKAWAVWTAAQGAIGTFASVMIEDPLPRAFASITISTASTVIAIQEFKKRGLIGEKMIVFMAVMQVVAALWVLNDGLKRSNNTLNNP